MEKEGEGFDKEWKEGGTGVDGFGTAGMVSCRVGGSNEI